VGAPVPPEYELPHAVIDPSALSSYAGDAPTDNGYTKIYSTQYAFAALKADGSITAWGSSNHGGTGARLN
jgi:hypothetical protein